MKRLFLSLVVAVVLSLLLAFTVSAEEVESVHNGRVDLNQKVTLDSGKEVNLFDGEGNALIWYLDANGELQSIRADDQRVKYEAAPWGVTIGNDKVGRKGGPELLGVKIVLDENTTIDSGKFVVFNIMDDDVLTNAGSEAQANKPVNCMKLLIRGSVNLEYVFLRLDTIAIQNSCFTNCQKLKYVNLEDLTELRRIGDGYQFSNCTSLFNGQILDLSKTKLISIDNGGTFNGVPLAGVIFPKTLETISDWTFQNGAMTSFAFAPSVTKINNAMFNECKKLTTVYLNNTLTSIGDKAFNNTALNHIFFVGTAEELNTLLDNTSETSNAPFWAVVGENRENLISYSEFMKLDDEKKSEKYVVYDYNYCEAFEGGKHIMGEEIISPCAGICTQCLSTVVNHVTTDNMTMAIAYESYLKEGVKTTTCKNEGCTFCSEESTPKLFVCLGYSTFLGENAGFILGYTVDRKAVSDYEEAMGCTLKYGVFAVSEAKLGDNEIIDANGNVAEGVIAMEMSRIQHYVFELKISGFNSDDVKKQPLAIGTYVIENGTEGARVSYLQQDGDFNEEKGYSFITYNQIAELTNR